VVVGRFQLNDDVLIWGVVAEPVNDTASADVLASKGFQIHGAAVFDLNGLGIGPGAAQQDKDDWQVAHWLLPADFSCRVL
jgi:hypothetical protein